MTVFVLFLCLYSIRCKNLNTVSIRVCTFDAVVLMLRTAVIFTGYCVRNITQEGCCCGENNQAVVLCVAAQVCRFDHLFFVLGDSSTITANMFKFKKALESYGNKIKVKKMLPLNLTYILS